MPTRARRSPSAKGPRSREPTRHYLVELTTFEGEDTACYLMGADPTWIVIAANPSGGASIVDRGYRSLEEARAAWPDAVAPAPGRKARARGDRSGWNRVPPVLSEPWFQKLWRRGRASAESRED